MAQFLYQCRSTPHSTTGRSPAELFIGRPLRNHMDLLRPADLADQMETRQRAQKQYADRGTRAVSVQKGDTVWVTSVDRLQGANGRNWLPTWCSAIEACSVKVTVMLTDGRVICRHVDHVRRRETETVPEGVPGPGDREGDVCEDVLCPLEPPALESGRRAENRILRRRPTAEPDRFVAVWSNTDTQFVVFVISFVVRWFDTEVEVFWSPAAVVQARWRRGCRCLNTLWTRSGVCSGSPSQEL